MSWGYKITIVYIAFITMICGMVYVASKQTNEMQDENYYAKELVYQTVVNGKDNLSALSGKVEISTTEQQVQITLPKETTGNISGGHIRLMRPSEQKKDIDIALAVNANGQQYIPMNKFSKGLYKLQLNWKNNNKDYYFEKDVIIQKI